jgi:short-subunit dehydrogenase
VVSARSAEKLSALAANEAHIIPFPLDVTDHAAVADTVKEIETTVGPIDLAILNAATWQIVEAATFDYAAIKRGVDVNYLGVVSALDALLPGMIERGRGHIAIVASTAGYRGLPRSAAYGPTKAALINLAETLHIELQPLGITVSVICPGFVDTPATQKNNFPMPGIISASAAADAIISGLMRGKFDISFPWHFVLAMKFLRLLPHRLYFWLVRKFIWK